jgi:hypothetical protein
MLAGVREVAINLQDFKNVGGRVHALLWHEAEEELKRVGLAVTRNPAEDTPVLTLALSAERTKQPGAGSRSNVLADVTLSGKLTRRDPESKKDLVIWEHSEMVATIRPDLLGAKANPAAQALGSLRSGVGGFYRTLARDHKAAVANAE